MRVTRRSFLQALGGTAGAAALVGGHLAGAQQAGEGLRRWATPEETLVPSICQQCPGGCGLLVRTLDGEVAGISGNPLHPINRGALCPKAFGGLQLLYDRDRVKGPLARAGARGSFRSIGWDEALGLVTARLSELRAQGLAHTVAILGGQYRGYRDTLWKRFADAYGTANYIRVRCLAPERPALAHQLMQGVTTPLGYDLGEAQFILSFGAGLLEAWLGPVHASQAFARLRRSGERPRGRFVQVDPRRSPTAVKADRWVPIVPGTDGLLALGIANVMLREGLYDREFVDAHAAGFEDWTDRAGQRVAGFKNVILQEYGLLTVSTATGVPVKTILEIARDLGTIKPALVIGERGPAYGPEDLHTRMAIHCLNALAGNIGVRGGLLIQGQLPLTPLAPARSDEVAQRAREHPRIDGAGQGDYLLAPDVPQLLPYRMMRGSPHPINALFLFATNPLANHPAKEAFAQALDGVPFVVSFSPFLDESTAKADLILPDSTYLERWQDDPVSHLAGFSSFSLAPPASVPLHHTRNTADVVLQLAKTLGGSVAESFPWAGYEDLLYESARGLYEAGRGHVVAAPAEEALRKILERQGYWAPEFEAYDDFWDALRTRGAWWDPTGLPLSRKALLRTPSGKFEFSSRQMPVPVPAAGAAFPLRLSTYRLMSRPVGGGRNQPWLLEQPAVHVRASWRGWVEIHPKTAAALGIADGDQVWVESPKGRIRLTAKLYAGTLPEVVHIPLFAGEGPNPNDLIANETDRFRGFGLLNTTRVKISRA
jgi:anaerobic selenocysteine-containing dehydrogenase